MRATRGERVFAVLNYSFMTVFSFLCLYPFLLVLAISLNDALDAQRGGILLLPRQFTLLNYEVLFQDASLLRAFGVTVARVALSIGTQVLANTLFAYAMSRRDFILRRFLKWWIFIPMYFSGGLIPFYIVLYYAGLLNRFLTYIVPGLYGSFYIILLMSGIRGISGSLCEAAEIDGANDPVILFRVILPLLKPVLATVALFIGVGAWNDWYTGYTFISNADLWCAQNWLLFIMQSADPKNVQMLQQMRPGAKMKVTAESVKMAMLIVTTVPIVCIYPFLQKYFVKGVMIGSLKE